MTLSQGFKQLSYLLNKLELKTCIIDIHTLKPHEEVYPEKVNQVKKDIISRGYIKYPVLVDLRTFVILDGHHRIEALKQLGIKMAPVFFVDYNKNYIIVKSFRKNFIVTKEIVINAGLKRKLLPPKTSRHVLIRVVLPASFIPIYILNSSIRDYCLPVIENPVPIDFKN